MLLVTVGLLVFLVVDRLESEASELHILAVNYDAVIRWCRGHAVLTTSHDLELVIIEHRDMGDRSCSPCLIFILIFLNKGGNYLLEFIFVKVELMKFIFIF